MPATSTNTTLDLKPQLPRDLDAIAILINKETKPGSIANPAISAEARAAIDRVLESGINKGKSNEVAIQAIHAGKGGPARIIVIGHGEPKKLSAACLREAAAVLAKQSARLELSRVALVVPDLPDQLPGSPDTDLARDSAPVAVQAMAEGLVLGAFDFDLYRGTASQKDNGKKISKKQPIQFTIILDRATQPDVKDALSRGRIIGESQNFARTIAFRPGNDINPPSLAKVAQDLAREVGLKVRVMDEREMQKLGMGGILGVGKGSSTTPPRMIVLEWPGGGAAKARGHTQKTKGGGGAGGPLLVVGKAITFDTGGISIKPAANMQRMIFDKCGGMAVLGFMAAVARLKLPRRIVGILAAAENHISETAYRPGDILRFYNGVTVEITNTDAEGRLVLGDALAWGCETYKPAAVIDLATLTGGVIVALGKEMAGVMTMSDELMNQVQSAADRAAEKIWRLPLNDEMKEMLKSEMGADIVNSGGREGHPLQGAVFLRHFVPDEIPWMHMDIAGTADTEKETPLYKKGATGWGVRTLVEWASAS
jgi:leucyl aminopeptidase